MSMNRYMHPRNRYRREKPDFAQLARDNPDFAAASQLDDRGRVVVNFKLPHQLAALTRALLQRDFQLSIEMPMDRLIPTLPLRLNYLHWLEDILGVADDSSSARRGIDIGTGSCCIYPLLAARCHPNWSFLATEVDKRNAAYAEENVRRNGLQDRVTVALVPPDAGPLEFPMSREPTDQLFDFCMCNPPFFADAAEAQGLLNSRSVDRDPPMSASTAASVESFSSGGEVMFVTRIAQESSRHRSRCRIFTSMLGRKPSLKPLKRLLERLGVTSYGTYEFCQGRVMRWGIGWTYQPGVNFPMSEFKRRKLQSRPPLTLQLPQRSTGESGQPDPEYNLEIVYRWCKRTLKRRLHIDCWDQLVKQGATGRRMRISAKEVTWTRQRQQRRHPSAGAAISGTANTSQKSVDFVAVGDQSCGDAVNSPGHEGEVAEKDVINSQDEFTECQDDVTKGQDDVTKVKDDVTKGQRATAKNRKRDQQTSVVSSALSPPEKRARLQRRSRSPRKQAPASSTVSKQKEPPAVLVANLSLDYNNSGVLELELGWLDGSGREAMHQLLLCLRNLYAANEDASSSSSDDGDDDKEAHTKTEKASDKLDDYGAV